ncbi:uncharacterized protein ASPGLDRAFT_1409789 [Aspergillus glaucus CBS 516.65]|uniref:Uncharacterized protein n=1 Tax=Aspergillus glaucus CBS 516.65 TaxID=1160497 RepID=A0A1L9VM44_ASPGL|nr:hypothetical protein ASPGLDRAFT_1409789 [Aspergillus glaucus CBS 516.65]OJJ85007.1 hypothetical protein ASPGLDRAFT_1409789 [Aspergillus glaucus CBS 516.65]
MALFKGFQSHPVSAIVVVIILCRIFVGVLCISARNRLHRSTTIVPITLAFSFLLYLTLFALP